jgi:hypothetical protein
MKKCQVYFVPRLTWLTIPAPHSPRERDPATSAPPLRFLPQDRLARIRRRESWTCSKGSPQSPSCARLVRLRLIIVHNHFRPGGVRRVIELAAPCLLRGLASPVDRVVLATGQPPEPAWLEAFRGRCHPIPVDCQVEPALAYLAEQHRSPKSVVLRLQAFLSRLLAGQERENGVVWTHNPGLGRNLLLARELQQACQTRNVRLVFHHHDWWFDNRWERWPEFRRVGFRSLRQVANAILPAFPNVRHITINRVDASILQPRFSTQAAWLPNPAEAVRHPSKLRQRAVRAWLESRTAPGAPVWLMPCRLLRRKNIAEALLLTRWLRPEAWLVTTGGPSSAVELPYAARLARAAQAQGWPLQLGVLQASEQGQPSVPELLAASEAVLLTSLQEGFGLPCLEAAFQHRPLFVRSLPNVLPDLRALGFRFPYTYQELRVAPSLFDWAGEIKRQTRLLAQWRSRMPRSCQAHLAQPLLLAAAAQPQPVPFSRLTLTAQLEVLSVPVELSWRLCAPLNPFLRRWRAQAGAQTLQPTPCPARAAASLEGKAYACRFRQLLEVAGPTSSPPDTSEAAQWQFIQERLDSSNLYPLNWAPRT